MKEISSKKPIGVFMKIDYLENLKMFKSEVYRPKDNLNINFLCEKCEYSIIAGLKSKCVNINYCVDCVIEDALKKAIVRFRGILRNKETGGGK